MKNSQITNLTRSALISLLIYSAPILLIFIYFYFTGDKPWAEHATATHSKGNLDSLTGIVILTFENLRSWGLVAIVLVLGIIEFSFGLYDKNWDKNEKTLDVVCFIVPKLVIAPIVAYFSLQLLPSLLPNLANVFSWVPFLGGVLIIAVADDLTQYWYHRLHHEVPFLWRFHRTHHSAPYMGMAMASRQNIIYTLFFSQTYLTATLVYLGLGFPASFVRVVKSLITTFAHSSIPWDKPFYKYKFLHPLAWVIERAISTPATHHAHHADNNEDGIGHYKGNFGNMFFIWDIIFGTGHITRQYPKAFGLNYYQREEWYAQFLWPFFKSKVKGSELSSGGPEVFDGNHPDTEIFETTKTQYV